MLSVTTAFLMTSLSLHGLCWFLGGLGSGVSEALGNPEEEGHGFPTTPPSKRQIIGSTNPYSYNYYLHV